MVLMKSASTQSGKDRVVFARLYSRLGHLDKVVPVTADSRRRPIWFLLPLMTKIKVTVVKERFDSFKFLYFGNIACTLCIPLGSSLRICFNITLRIYNY